jgi:hypothetical protein
VVNPERRHRRALAVLLVTVASLSPIWQTTRNITDHCPNAFSPGGSMLEDPAVTLVETLISEPFDS